MQGKLSQPADDHMSLRNSRRGWTFDWFGTPGNGGGEYIEVTADGAEYGFAVINTRPDKGPELLPFTEENFRKEVDEWYEDNAKEY